MKTTGSRVGLGAAMRSLTQTESMSQRSQSSINSSTLSGDSLSNAPSPKAIPMRIFKGTPILIFPHQGGRLLIFRSRNQIEQYSSCYASSAILLPSRGDLVDLVLLIAARPRQVVCG